MRLWLSILLCIAGVARADIIANGIFCNGTIGPTNNIPTGGGGGGAPGDGYEANLYAYFKMEEADGNYVDSVAGFNMTWDSGSDNPATQTGIIGQAGNMAGAHDFGSDSKRTADDHFEFSGHDFTIRFWIYPTDESFGKIIDRRVVFGGFEITFLGSDKIYFEVDTGSSDGDITTTSTLSTFTWHRVIAWHKNGVEIGVQIDNDAPVTLSYAGGMDAVAGLNFFFRDCLSGVDEVAFWKDYVLTSDDRLFDWNSGAGQTFPLP